MTGAGAPSRLAAKVLSLAAIAAGVLFLLPTRAPSAQLPSTHITINGNGGDREFDGVGAILGGGGNARYLVDYPAAPRRAILDYLFKPGYGASLQLLKLEIGGDGNSTDGAEPSIEHTSGQIDCNAGYEFDIARQALAIDRRLKLYGLQWGAPAWVGAGGSLFTDADIRYLLDWLQCAGRHGLHISYLGGWNERDDGSHASWFARLRSALDAHGYRQVRIVAGDNRSWEYASSPSVAILGVHDNCGYPTGLAGARTTCDVARAALASGKPLWGSELGAMDRAVGKRCPIPCAPAMDRAFVREYLDARVTGALEWPALDSMPARVLPHEDQGLITADQPWSGSYRVNAMTWAIAQITQFVSPPTRSARSGWRYIDSASGYMRGNRSDGSYVSFVRGDRSAWSTIVEATAGVKTTQRADFSVMGGHGLAGRQVHVWASDFNPGSSPARWFRRLGDIKPKRGRFSLTIKPGYVYSLTTTTGQGKGTASAPRPARLRLPYHSRLATGADGEPSQLAPEDGAFQLTRCHPPDRATTCTQQTAVSQPVLWSAHPTARHPYALIGSDWRNYKLSVDVRVLGSGSAGLIGRYDAAATKPSQGTFDGYTFDVNTAGTFSLAIDRAGSLHSLATGSVSFASDAWHRLALSLAGPRLTASVDGHQVAAVSDSRLKSGMPGIETGGWYPVQFSGLSITGA